MAIADPAAAAVEDGGRGLDNGGMEEELTLARRMAYAASSKGELLGVIRKTLLPLVRDAAPDDNESTTGFSRSATRSLCLLLVELALSATCNDFKSIGRAVREVLRSGLEDAPSHWPLLPDVMATVLTGAQARCTFAEARVASLRLWAQLLEHQLRDASKRKRWKQEGKRRKQALQMNNGEEQQQQHVPPPVPTVESLLKSEVVAKALTAQAALVDGLMSSLSSSPATSDRPSLRDAGIREITRLLENFPSLLPEVYKRRLVSPSFSSSSLWLLATLVDFYRTRLPLSTYAAAKKDFFEVYLREAINSKSKPSPSSLASFASLLSTVTAEDITEPLGPALEKALKKSPAGVLGAVTALATQLPLDLSPYVDTLFLPAALRMVKSMEEEPRGEALALLGTLAQKVGDSAVFARVVSDVVNVLLGKTGGALAQWFQRHACVVALRALARGGRRLPRSAVAPATTAALEGLVAAFGREAHEGTRAEILAALGEWLGLVDEEGKGLSPMVLKALRKGVEGSSSKDKEALLPLLLAIRDALAMAPSLREGLKKELVEPLEKVVRDGAKKALQVGNVESVVALHCLVEMEGLSGSSGEYAKLLMEKESWLFAPTQVDACVRASHLAPVALSMVRLLVAATRTLGVSAVIGQMANFEEEESLGVRNAKPATLTLLEMLLHPNQEVRIESKNAVALMLQEDAALTRMALVKGLWVKVDLCVARKQEAAGMWAAGAIGDDLDSSVSKAKAEQRGSPCPQRFADALASLFPTVAQEGEGAAAAADAAAEGEVDPGTLACLPMAMVLAHHPVVSESTRQAAGLWHRLMRGHGMGGPGGVEGGLDDISVDISDEVIQAIMAPGGGAKAHRVAGQRCLSALANSLGHPGRELLVDGVVPALLVQLQRPELVEMEAGDVAIYFHSAASVCQTHKLGVGGGGGRTSEGQVRRMRTGRRGNVYDAEEEKWEEEFKRKKAAEKEKEAGGQTGPSPEEQKLLLEEAEIRGRIGGLRQEAVAVFDALVSLAKQAPAVAHISIPEALTPLTPLLRSRLLENEAYEALRALAMSVESNIQPLAWDLAAAVRLVVVAGEGDLKVFRKLADVLARVIDYLTAFCSHVYKERLSGPTFTLLFPVLRAVLMDACPGLNMGETYGEALSILAAHADFGQLSSTPALDVGPSEAEILRPLRRPMIEVILHVLKAHPRSEPAPGGSLISLLMGPALSVGEWAPLLGNAGLLSREASVRLAVLEAIEAVAGDGKGLGSGKASLTGNPLLESRLWLAKHDEDEEVAEAGDRVWEVRGADLSGMYTAPLLVLLGHETARVRMAAGKAMAAAVVELPDTATLTLTRLLDLFKANEVTPEETERPTGEAYFLTPLGGEEASAEEKATKEQEKAKAREGVAKALEEMGKLCALAPEDPHKHLEIIFPFLLRFGVVDPCDAVRQHMVSAGMALIDAYGASQAASLLPIFEGVLETPAERGEDLRAFDWRREGTVVLMGSTARHLDKTDPKILSIVDRLLDALSTPSGPVQRAVALCMVPLMPACKSQAGDYAAKLLNAALKGDDYGTRRGAAYGISALVKGLGIASLKQHGIMSSLELAAASSSPAAKQGALFCFECLCDRLKLLFEPYVIVILPLLLRCFSDSSDHVRDAAGLAAKAIMGNLSPHGVKLVLPTILKALDDSAWRSKAAALSLLGAMAYCAPKQLSSCLPQIVPRMTEAFGDTHPKVRESGKTALGDIGKVIRNPEIRKLSPLLLSALYDPAKNTKDALDGLLACEFMHSVDAPSLALLIPIVQRGLKDRAAELKRKASLITGNMCSMISDARDLVPYLPALLPGLKGALVDPIPDVRATTARALGSLMRGMGEESLFDLVPWLVQTLKTDASSVERSGGAQGLAQVLVFLGDVRVRAVLLDLLALKGHPRYSVREGVLWVLSFLPPALGPGFTPYLSDTLPVILAGLTDETESVREVALQAGQVLVSTHGKHHADELLPSLEAGLFDDSWRIRQSSVQLLGDLLYTIGGTKAVGLALDNAGDDDAGGRGVSRAELAINSVLGPKRRAKILASLYVIRSDTSAVVRQSALQVWKTVVSNTPRVLREVLPTLIEILIGALASNNMDKRTVGGRALGDIVRKLGDQILPEIVPHLRRELVVGDTDMRQGVCLGLAEIMDCAQKKQIEDFASTLVEAIIDALTDPAASVREQAGQAFLAFHRILGGDAISRVVPPMLVRLDEEQKLAAALEEGREEGDGMETQGRALLGVRELLRARPREVLGYLLPKLTKPPVTISHARTLEAVAEVTGSTLHFHASILLPLLVGQIVIAEEAGKKEGDQGEARRLAALQSCTRTIVTSVESNGLQHLVVDLTKLLEASNGATRRWGTWAVGALAKGTRADLRPQAPILLKFLLPLLNDTQEAVWASSVQALRALLENLGVDEALSHLDFMRNVMASVVSDARRRKGGVGDAAFALPGLNVAGGLDPFLPVYTQGLLQGSPNQKEVAASWMGELLDLMTPTALRPYIAKVVGPLIRIASDKTFSPAIKCAILNTMTLLLEKGGVALRGLAPQLQTTFTKALNDTHQNVRDRAAQGLGRLVHLSTRIDPLVTELVTGAVSSPAGIDVQTAMLKALGQVLGAAGDRVSPPVVGKAVDQLAGLLGHQEEALRKAAAEAVGRVIALLPEDAVEGALRKELFAREGGSKWPSAQGRALALGATLKSGIRDPKLVPFLEDVVKALKEDVDTAGAAALSDQGPVRDAALHALARLVVYGHNHATPEQVAGFVASVVPGMTAALSDMSSEVRKAAAGLIKTIAKSQPAALRPYLVTIIPPLLEGVKDMDIRVKYVSERALLYALEIHSRSETLGEFVAQAPTEPAKFVRDYAKRILVRLKADSDDEKDGVDE